jgi:hypothetical protein
VISPHSSPALRAGFPVDATLRTGWKLFRVSFLACLPLALLAICAGGAPQAFALTTGHSLDLGWWLVYVASTLLMLLCYGAIILRQHGLLVGADRVLDSGIGASLLGSARQLPGVLLLMLLALPMLLAGLALLVVPGLAVGVCLLLAWPMVLVERVGPLAAMQRAAQHLRGHFWRVLAAFAIAGAGVLVFVVLAGVFAGVIMLAAQANATSAGARAFGTLVLSLIMVPPVLYLCAVLVVTRLHILATEHQHG